MNVLLLNAGSSSLKASVLSPDSANGLFSATAEWAGHTASYQSDGENRTPTEVTVDWRGHAEAVSFLIDDLNDWIQSSNEPIRINGVGHRVVHGGNFAHPVEITSQVRRNIEDLVDLAPLHNPASLATIDAAAARLPHLKHVAVFDTAFHATIPQEAHTYAIPQRWTREWNIRKYGFHGLSHQYCSQQAARLLNRQLDELRVIVCHLGHGCSAACVQFGQCVDTTMGFTPLDGLVMGTRSGSIDPGILFHLQRTHGLSADELESQLNRRSGLLGVSGTSADMREVLAAADDSNDARLAVSIYCRRVRQTIGAFAATMGGVDAVVLTAGVGENSAAIREQICTGLDHLGIQLDAARNESAVPDEDVATQSATCRILVIRTREDLTMRDEVIKVLR